MPTHNQIDLVEFHPASVGQVHASKKFFGDVFGWKFTEYGPDYIDTHDSGTVAGFTSDASAGSSTPLTVIYVDDLEAAYAKVKTAGGTITKETFAFPGGRRFHFRDPGGNELAAWSK